MTLTDIFACPQCKQYLTYKSKKQHTFLYCQQCKLLTPIVEGFPLFTESNIDCNDLMKLVTKLTNKFSDTKAYESYLESKYERGVMEVYAAFQPFNESSRSIYPFIDYLQSNIEKDDLIIDTWSRTGWSALLLASLFPEQQVISLWEGDNSVLGYSGYGYWFSEKKRPKNLTIAFLAPKQNLPFKDNSIRIIHGHDIIHRRPMKSHIIDLLRVTLPTGVIMLPHIHLSNSEPTPYFQRGGQLRHGMEYKQLYSNLVKRENFTAIVLSETELFESQRPMSLNDASDGSEYNAMIIVAPPKLFQHPLSENWLIQNIEKMRLIANPILSVCFITRQISINSIGNPDQVPYLLERHQVYKRRLDSIIPKTITPLQRDILMYASTKTTLISISEILNLEISKTIEAIVDLTKNEIVTLLPVSAKTITLQNFHANQHKIINENFVQSIENSLKLIPNKNIITLDNEPVTVAELVFLINGWRRYLQLKNNATLLYITTENELTIPLVMACWLENIKVEVNPNKSINEIHLITNQVLGKNHSISFKNDTSNSYWNILDPFLSDEPLSFPSDIKVEAKIDKQVWHSWLSSLLNYLL